LTVLTTQRLYLEDAYLCKFNAAVLRRMEVDGIPAVLLDRSAFYPTGGGQPHDSGTVNRIPVLDVRDSEEGPIHLLKHRLDANSVVGEIDWHRRFDHMQQHTGQHVLTEACIRRLGANTVGFHLGANHCTIDLDHQALSLGALSDAEALANHVVAENRNVTSQTVAADQAARARVRGKAEQLSSVRLLEIEGFDPTGCGGTHVRSTAEIGAIKVLSVARHRGGTSRVAFLCGQRAFDDYCRKHNLVNELVHILTTGEEDLIAAIHSMEATYAASRKREKQLRQALIDREASALLSRAKSGAPSGVVRAIYDESPWDPDSVRALAARIAEDPFAVALLGWSGEKTQLTFVRGSEAHGHMGALMKLACESLRGRGGGRPDWAQGGCSAGIADLEGVLDHFYDKLEAEKPQHDHQDLIQDEHSVPTA